MVCGGGMISGIGPHGTLSTMGVIEGAGRPGQILEAVRRGLARAEELVRNPKEFLRLLTVAERRLDRIDAGPLTPLKQDLQALMRLLRASGVGAGERRRLGQPAGAAVAALAGEEPDFAVAPQPE